LYSNRLLRRAVSCLGLWSCLAAAESYTLPPAQDPQTKLAHEDSPDLPSWIDAIWDLPIFRFFIPFKAADRVLADPKELLPAPPPPPACSVPGLPFIEDEEAILFEESVQAGPRIDLAGLTPATSRALARFQKVVNSAGGDLWLTSAYRPAGYQQHLQAVWDKWSELRDNQQPECQDLKTAVAAEFTSHQLLTTQRPASVSDHTRGTGFDAAVTLTAIARHRRRRVNIDRLARRAGIHRPDIAHDPVHFRLTARSARRS
jgi:hypothetical protein